MKNREKLFLMIEKIKNPKVKAKIKKDFLRLVKLYDEKDRSDKIKKYNLRFKSFKIH